MANYCTLAEIKAQLPETLGSAAMSSDTSFDPLIDGLIPAVSRLIDREVGMWPDFFAASTAGETRYYDGNGDTVITIDPFVSLSAVAVAESGGVESSDYVAWSSSDYIVYPLNAAAKAQPYTELRVDIWNGSQLYFDPYPRAVRVTAVFGYSLTAPALVKQACIAQTMRYYMKAKNAYNESGMQSFGPVVIKPMLDLDIAQMLAPYKQDFMVY